MVTHIGAGDIQAITACRGPHMLSVDFCGRDDSFQKCLLESSENKFDFLTPFIFFVSKSAKAILHSALENVHNFGKKGSRKHWSKNPVIREQDWCPLIYTPAWEMVVH